MEETGRSRFEGVRGESGASEGSDDLDDEDGGSDVEIEGQEAEDGDEEDAQDVMIDQEDEGEGDDDVLDNTEVSGAEVERAERGGAVGIYSCSFSFSQIPVETSEGGHTAEADSEEQENKQKPPLAAERRADGFIGSNSSSEGDVTMRRCCVKNKLK